MGAKLKVLSVIVGLMLIPLNLWPLSLLLFAYAASGLFRASTRGRRRSGGGYDESSLASAPSGRRESTMVTRTTTVRFKGGLGSPIRVVLGIGMLLLAVIALTQHGTYSPLVFGAIGVVILVWKTPLMRFGNAGALRPMEESILLRRGIDPIHWFAIAEAKLATKQVGRALGGVNETLVVSACDKPSILVVLRTTSLTSRGAEDSLVARLREITRISAPLGAYILPLDSREAVEELARLPVEPVELEARGWPHPISVTDYDVLSMEVEGNFVRSVGAYRTMAAVTESESNKKKEKADFPPTRQVFSHPPLLWEIFQEMGKKMAWPGPDGYTSFLASMFATRGETIGERVAEANAAESPNQVLVQSLGTSPVQISRVQLRAIAKVYA